MIKSIKSILVVLVIVSIASCTDDYEKVKVFGEVPPTLSLATPEVKYADIKATTVEAVTFNWTAPKYTGAAIAKLQTYQLDLIKKVVKDGVQNDSLVVSEKFTIEQNSYIMNGRTFRNRVSRLKLDTKVTNQMHFVMRSVYGDNGEIMKSNEVVLTVNP